MGKKGKNARKNKASRDRGSSGSRSISVGFARGSSPSGLCHHGVPNLEAVSGIKTFYKYIHTADPYVIGKQLVEELTQIGDTTKETHQALAAIGTNLLLNPNMETEAGTQSANVTAHILLYLEAMYVQR